MSTALLDSPAHACAPVWQPTMRDAWVLHLWNDPSFRRLIRKKARATKRSHRALGSPKRTARLLHHLRTGKIRRPHGKHARRAAKWARAKMRWQRQIQRRMHAARQAASNRPDSTL